MLLTFLGQWLGEDFNSGIGIMCVEKGEIIDVLSAEMSGNKQIFVTL